ncbi:DUF1134 domain-containing protein [uncultured Croceicoccus sp.]|uniref:DUF1134 domain-containing protein n=1 Tax=uncultured Croceicoccus sp. TaxID=1295329 RepID=UPI002636EAC1|nr:DUF1134 domain-containing protein [uncultured Croceicoccus sp.]
MALCLAGAAQAQITTIDPNRAIDGDLEQPQPAPAPAPAPGAQGELPPVAGDPYADPYAAPPASDYVYPSEEPATVPAPAPAAPGPQPAPATPPAAASQAATTYQRDDVLGAAERAFGSGAEGLAKLVEEILSKQGEPNAYITGREAGGAFAVGLRYGEGTMYHKVEGEKPVYWTGPSIGFDAGANAGSTFILVYNLWDSEDLYERYPAGEGQAYVVGGFNASYVRKGDVVLIPIRMGVGVRLGINAGYLRFSKKHRWFPF